jgi:hypothetical protein
MTSTTAQLPNLLLVFLLSTTLAISAEPFPQDPQTSNLSTNTTQNPSNDVSNPSITPITGELPDAPTPVQPAQQSQDSPSVQPQNQGAVPAGAAGAKAPTVRGAPASRTVGAAIAPAKQGQRRSLLIKVGLVAGACVAIGSAFALSKGSPSKPPGAP